MQAQEEAAATATRGAVMVAREESAEARPAMRGAVVVASAEPAEVRPAPGDPVDLGRAARRPAALQVWTRAPAKVDRQALVAPQVEGVLP